MSSNTWVFDYLALLEAANAYGDYLYLWDPDINGCKHLQVRFYQIGQEPISLLFLKLTSAPGVSSTLGEIQTQKGGGEITSARPILGEF